MIYISIYAIVYSQRILVNIQIPSRPASQQQQQMLHLGLNALYTMGKTRQKPTGAGEQQ